ncbi:cupin domain-containing protein [Brevibacillus laterosporus]|uniref:Cupin domain protein n=1 Tax=Brevibacillus laterosporus LMG 15441 TaxID=1042163 RepID=A0A075R671_BRELA|nr:cupin domain-containing protein [Brevibacillus laterosporus]AIG26941.1 cupin domain protein [Brevibacillus laterosporus LMG 15441]RJL14613.1 cupin domain-containing protein [Brevibacillus laterosporus]TPH09575.1 cupin domain-containing protein [Brevibacillus laterosporus]
MYPRPCNYYQWNNPSYNHNWGYNWYPNYYNWNNNGNPYYRSILLKDYGSKPFVVNIAKAAKQNNTYRTALWTGKHFQVTLMSINVGDDIGLEVHPNTDQFIRIEEGQGLVQMGNSKDKLDFQKMAYDGYAIMIPAGTWHNVTNTGKKPLKIYVIYAPPEHPYGTVHKTKADAMSAEGGQ